ncbi:helix-turn-helix transcriptional regulator [Nocardiopsis sp. RV163]|uniref:helix-turn-helix domain-containing protein n=1 Tax=Nocardiopsis sp. RV163 TaxID=1661388 RepID=UPI00064BE0CF|nr:helix-turn-helix transcriptional regulator [Nocardiopsis sp. RV163]
MVEQNFGQILAHERKQVGYTLRRLASLANCSASTLSRWENGHVSPARDDVEKVDKALGVNGRLVREWEFATAGGLPPWMRDMSRLEEAAETIELISPHVVPGLLQSPQYLRLVMREGLHPGSPKEIDRLIALRSARYQYLSSKNDPNVIAVFPTSALTCVPEDVRKEQVARLLSVSSSGKVMVHLIPEGSILVGVTSMLLMFHLRGGGKAASADHVRGNVFYEETTGYDRLHGLVKRALGSALPAAQSREVLEKLL